MHKQDASRMRALASIICRLVAQGRLSFDAPTAYLIGARCLLLYKATKKGATSLLRVTWWFDLTVFGGDHGEERSADAASWRGPEGGGNSALRVRGAKASYQPAFCDGRRIPFAFIPHHTLILLAHASDPYSLPRPRNGNFAHASRSNGPRTLLKVARHNADLLELQALPEP